MEGIEADLLKPFSRVQIFDSSSWDISASLKDVFRGSGGSSSEANCKIHIGYEYKKGALSFYQITPGTISDRGFSKNINQQIKSQDLFLADLGYFSLKLFMEIDQKGAYFITRYSPHTALWSADDIKRIELEKILQHVWGNIYCQEVIMGAEPKKQVRCRLICLRVPEQVANERRRKLKRAAQKRRRTPSKTMLAMCDWILMITNIPEELLPAEKIYPFYRLRWQIELLFKQCKSILQIHKSATGKENRLRCELYGKLIVAVLIHRLHGFLNAQFWNTKQRELSMDKFWKRLQERAFSFMRLLIKSTKQAMLYLYREIECFIKNCFKLKQPSRLSSLEELQSPLKHLAFDDLKYVSISSFDCYKHALPAS